MEQIILILMLFIAINCAFKLSLWRWWQAGIYSLIVAAFTGGGGRQASIA